MRRLLQLIVGPERLASHRTFDRPKDMKVTGGARSGEYGNMEDTGRTYLGLLLTVERAVWGRGLSCWSETPVLRHPRRLDLFEGRR